MRWMEDGYQAKPASTCKSLTFSVRASERGNKRAIERQRLLGMVGLETSSTLCQIARAGHAIGIVGSVRRCFHLFSPPGLGTGK